ncbi:ergothioneine biosynthesis protein EgtB [Kineobactrum sediminis]|uniref:Ergothioneine biosynthesis protein EgtB n=1 Tax=Kineobactrum sediminis TaxID=1905677 RepID=A0A2N5Y636_9GAMM|nr:ergothioneine biosynthesis protein EgtB [Kineobactrum sediminis]PLW83839.1 ergothioneine biosynthesis protein EgtB [Kineobactrum sediminis]
MLSAPQLRREFQRVRQNSVRLCESLETEDYGLQAMADTSPPKWHLAHTTWFFETFILKPLGESYREWNPAFEHLFNSYYNGVGKPFSRPQRGLLSRPTVSEVYRYREAIDGEIEALLDRVDAGPDAAEILTRLELGLHHEQQHQELLLTDLKYSFHVNPLRPVYRPADPEQAFPPRASAPVWHEFAGGVVTIGAGEDRFRFDNETPRHRQFLEPFVLASRPVTNGDYRAFIEDGGYRRSELWLAEGWDLIDKEGWTKPLYWYQRDDEWWQYSLRGDMALDDLSPACHLSYYEADAFARWYGARLPTEAEWEHAASGYAVEGNFAGCEHFHPRRQTQSDDLCQLFGDVWEWTASSYLSYPGFMPASGALGEYNGKFMSSQMILRGGSCVSDAAHIRATYRNFFYPGDRWQFSGARLARSL